MKYLKANRTPYQFDIVPAIRGGTISFWSKTYVTYDNEIRVTQSVLDRLIDLEPRVSTEPPKSMRPRPPIQIFGSGTNLNGC